MKVAAKATRSLAALMMASRADLSTRSILLMMRILGCRTSASRSRIASVSSSSSAFGIDQQACNVGIVHPRPGIRHHGAVEPPLRRKNARCVDEDELRAAGGGDAAQQRAGCLHLVRYDRHLAADERVDQRRFADIGRPDQRDEPAASRRPGRRLQPPGDRAFRRRRALATGRRVASGLSHRRGPP